MTESSVFGELYLYHISAKTVSKTQTTEAYIKMFCKLLGLKVSRLFKAMRWGFETSAVLLASLPHTSNANGLNQELVEGY